MSVLTVSVPPELDPVMSEPWFLSAAVVVSASLVALLGSTTLSATATNAEPPGPVQLAPAEVTRRYAGVVEVQRVITGTVHQ